MDDPWTLLSAACLVLVLVTALQSLTVPALWWLYVRQAAKLDALEARATAAEADVRKLDEVLDKIGAGVTRGAQQ